MNKSPVVLAVSLAAFACSLAVTVTATLANIRPSIGKISWLA